MEETDESGKTHSYSLQPFAEDSAVVLTQEAQDDLNNDRVADKYKRDRSGVEFTDSWKQASTKVCVDAGRSGLKCGNYIGVQGDVLRYSLPSPTEGGDSGSTVFIVDSANGNRATVVGIHIGREGYEGRATLMSTIEKRLGI